MAEEQKRDDPLTSKLEKLLQRRLSRQEKALDNQQTITRRARVGEAVPLTFEQLPIWLQYKIDPNLPLYNIPGAFQIEGDLSVPALEKAINQVIERHHILRTIYLEKNGKPFQQVLSDWDFKLIIDDLQNREKPYQEREIQQKMDQFSKSAFNLEAEIPIKAVLYQLGEKRYILQLLIHHIAGDGWSRRVLSEELSTAYNQNFQPNDIALPELSIQYPDYALWQKDFVQNEGYKQMLEFWREQLIDPPSELDIPTDFPISTEPNFAGDRYFVSLPESLSQELKGWSARHNGTLFITMLTAMVVWLWRYSGQKDVITGVPVAGREYPELHPLIGCFINTLAVRRKINPQASLVEFFEACRQGVFEALSHQGLPLEMLLQQLRPQRGRDGHVLYHTLLDFVNFPQRDPALHGCQVQKMKMYKGYSMFDLALIINPNQPQIEITFEYQKGLFTRQTIERMADHYVNLLKGFVDNSNAQIGRIALLSDQEQQQIIYSWNQTTHPFPFEGGVHRLFERQVERTPERIAVSSAGQSLTYRQLNNAANQLARYLVEQGVRQEALVGLHMTRSINLVISLLAVLKAGGAYIPIDLDYPQKRIRYMLEDSNCQFLILDGGSENYSMGTIPSEMHLIDLQHLQENLKSYSERNLSVEVDAKNLAYVIYTSGSTGEPKGVMITHGALENHVHWMQSEFPLKEDDKVLQKTPFSFDASVWEFYAPLEVGGELVLAKPDGHRDAEYLVETIQKEGITIIQTVPTLLRLLLELDGFPKCATLRGVFSGGETLTKDLVVQFYKKMQADLINLYGPSEACIDSTVWLCDAKTQRIPIGKPIANVQNYVLDANLSPVPIGVIGELYVAGAGLGRGYLNKPGLTAEKFIPNPFSGNGERMYRTGDLARYLPDGNIEYIGRTDFQVKLRGYRIELGEIESILLNHPGVQNVIVAVRQVSEEDSRLIAYIIPNEGGGIQPEMLSNYLRKSLPEYMIPNAYVFLREFPLSPSGKVDRKALPLAHQENEFMVAQQKPKNILEQALALIWGEVLDLESVAVDKSFFDLGGHSLLAIKLAAEISEFFQVKIPLTMIFEHPTVASMAEAIKYSGAPLEMLEQIAALMLQVESMSEEEIKRRLRDMDSSQGG